MKRPIALAAALLLLAACSNDLSPSDPGYSAGVLGNGGFAFTCDDSVVCGKYNAATEFPDAVATGSTFSIRFVPRTSQQKDAVGVTVGAVGDEYISSAGGTLLLAMKEGTGTLVATDAGGSIVDYQPLKIQRPDEIVVYDADDPDNVVPVTDTQLGVNAQRTFNGLARRSGANLAGTLKYAWTTSDSDVLAVYADGTGQVVVTGKKAGTASLTASGGTFEESITVTVQ